MKLERLYGDHPTLDRGAVRPVEPVETSAVRSQLGHWLGTDASADGLTLVLALKEKRNLINAPNATDPGFSLADCFRLAHVAPRPHMYLNWHRFEELDQVDSGVLAAHFDDFWYPKADDIDIFDSSLSWILSVDHDGFAYLTRLDR